jgi:cobyric acid synthase
LKILENYKGIKNNTKNNFDYKLFKDFQYDELAKIVRENVNLKKIYEIIFNNS